MLKRVQLVHIIGTAAPPSRKLHLAIDKMALSLRNLRILGHNKEVYWISPACTSPRSCHVQPSIGEKSRSGTWNVGLGHWTWSFDCCDCCDLFWFVSIWFKWIPLDLGLAYLAYLGWAPNRSPSPKKAPWKRLKSRASMGFLAAEMSQHFHSFSSIFYTQVDSMWNSYPTLAGKATELWFEEPTDACIAALIPRSYKNKINSKKMWEGMQKHHCHAKVNYIVATFTRFAEHGAAHAAAVGQVDLVDFFEPCSSVWAGNSLSKSQEDQEESTTCQ